MKISPTAPTSRASGAGGDPLIKGFTTNPTLMRKAGITDYGRSPGGARARPRPADLVRGVLRRVRRDGAPGARDRHLGRHVYVKIPVTNTEGQPAYELVQRLSHAGVKVNVTA